LRKTGYSVVLQPAIKEQHVLAVVKPVPAEAGKLKPE
jgi:hypothetical protein